MLDHLREKCEADFRYRLIRILEHREEITPFSEEQFKKRGLRQILLNIKKIITTY